MYKLIFVAVSIILFVIIYPALRLLYLEKKIFPFFIEDIPINSDINSEKYCNTFRPYVFNLSELNFLIKYKKFIQSETYSMGAKNEIDQMHYLIKQIETDKIHGDIIEAGVWRGGMSMWIKANLNYYKSKRNLYLFDTFAEFPHGAHPKDKTIDPIVQILFDDPPSLDEVRNNFKKFNLLDQRVKFIQGEISSEMQHITSIESTSIESPSIESPSIESISILRLDLDYYEPTLIMLERYYWKISKGGYVVIDDYNNNYLDCKTAVDYFRAKYGINNPITQSKGAVYWKI
jgi:hypothetical protein